MTEQGSRDRPTTAIDLHQTYLETTVGRGVVRGGGMFPNPLTNQLLTMDGPTTDRTIERLNEIKQEQEEDPNNNVLTPSASCNKTLLVSKKEKQSYSTAYHVWILTSPASRNVTSPSKETRKQAKSHMKSLNSVVTTLKRLPDKWVEVLVPILQVEGESLS